MSFLKETRLLTESQLCRLSRLLTQGEEEKCFAIDRVWIAVNSWGYRDVVVDPYEDRSENVLFLDGQFGGWKGYRPQDLLSLTFGSATSNAHLVCTNRGGGEWVAVCSQYIGSGDQKSNYFAILERVFQNAE
ncbi:MAG TPA: hypothetical protein PKZ16_00950 [bacterium]|nr:hypothetical protein [bacterium]HPL95451.1 hypothetical protein [bacterium]